MGVTVTRSKGANGGQAWQEVPAGQVGIDTELVYHPLQAVKLIKSQELTRFDPTVEVHMRLGVDVRHADQQLRGP